MRYLLILILSVSCIAAQSQQINPVPDYIFRNQMSVGRNAVTDTAAYMSIGPRYGANKGLMPPIVVDTLTVTASPKRNGLLIFSVQKNKYVYWDSVRVQWSDMAGSSGSYIKGSGTITYIPKFTDSITLGNSAMYDSSGFVRLYKNNIGNVFNHNDQNPVAGLTLVKDGVRGYPMIIQQNDSITNNIQLALLLRKGLLTSDTVRPGYGVGIEMNLQDNTRQWRRSGWIINNIVDSTIGTFKSEMATMVRNGANFIYPLIVRPDSTIRVLKLSGLGVRNVVADANGDLSIGSATNSVDTLSIATRAWRQKGDDSLGAIIATKQNTLTNPVTGLGITGYIPKWSSTSALDSSQLFQSAGFVSIGNTSPSYKLDISGTLRNTTGAAFATSSGNVLVGTTVDGGSYKLDVQGALRNTTGAVFATSSGNVGIGTASPSTGFKLEVEGSLFNRFNAALAFNDTAKVGIGISVPTDKLHVVGTGRFTGVLNTGSTSSVGIQMAAGTAIRTTGDIYHDFGTGGTGTFNVRGGSGFGNYITVLNAGNVGMNTTAPTERLDVNGRARVRTIDSTGTGTAMNILYADATGVIKKAAVPSGSGTITTAEADISSNYTVTATDHFVFLPALESAGRNVVLPNDAAAGRVLIIFNTSNDGTYKWTFTNEDVEDAAGAAVTTLTNQKSYTMVYYAGKFRVTAIN